MKKVFISIFSILFLINIALGDKNPFNDSDNYVNYNVYIHADSSNGEPFLSKIKNVKGKELDLYERNAIQKNMSLYFSKEKDMSYTTMYDMPDLKNDRISMTLNKPVYMKGKEQITKNMPVLDQAETDTCVTFSSTAAIDILSGQGKDVYSIYMTLRLGHALSLNFLPLTYSILANLKAIGFNEYYNPWDGSEIFMIMAQIKDFGAVKKKDKNTQNGLFGTTVAKTPITKAEMKDFKKIPSLSFNILFHTRICRINEIFKTESDFVKGIKKEIDKGNPVLIGLFLAPEYGTGNNGMIACTKTTDKGNGIFTMKPQKNWAEYNTWCIDKSLAKYIEDNTDKDNLISSHAMIIIGYIENTVNKNEGVFILRNSWGADNGDKGNNYVTYKYAYYLSDELLVLTNTETKGKGAL